MTFLKTPQALRILCCGSNISIFKVLLGGPSSFCVAEFLRSEVLKKKRKTQRNIAQRDETLVLSTGDCRFKSYVVQFRSLFTRRKREKHNITRNRVSNREFQSVRSW